MVCPGSTILYETGHTINPESIERVDLSKNVSPEIAEFSDRKIKQKVSSNL